MLHSRESFAESTFSMIFGISGLGAAFRRVDRLWAALPGAQHSDECIRLIEYNTWLVETELFSFCKAILYRPTTGQIVAKRVCGYREQISQNERYLSKPLTRLRRAWYSMEIKGQGFRF